ncbi:MAG: ABC transporter ATP-binding protein [Acidimicrobiales bacterium]
MIRLEQVTKRYGARVAVDALSLEVASGETCVLVGPSGCGKTTTVRMINRLVEPSDGRIFLDGEDVTNADPVDLRRRIGYVIQSSGLFPHQKVAENVACVPRLLGWDKARTRRRVDELLELVGLDPGEFAGRYPHELSGGQAQRVGVARALGADPPLLLMDEPFGATDPITRERLQGEFLALQGRLGKTVVMVTHDIEEAVRMGDRIAIMAQGGRLEQYDTPTEVLGHPATEFVASFVGAERGLRRMAVTHVQATDLESVAMVGPDDDRDTVRGVLDGTGADFAVVVNALGAATGWVPRLALDRAGPGPLNGAVRPLPGGLGVGDTLKSALALILGDDAGWAPVSDAGRFLGVLTPASVHHAMRRRVN